MKRSHIAALTLTVVTPLIMPGTSPAQATNLTVLCSTPMRHALAELVPRFEQMTKQHVAVIYGASPELKEKIDRGEPFDLAVLTPGPMDALIKAGRIAAEARTSLARVGIGVAIRAGAKKPDIRTTDALKQTLLQAKTITYGTEGASGAYFAGLIERLGIAETLKPKIHLKTSGEAVGQAVASGEAEIGILPVTEIMAIRGAELLGTFPIDIQDYVVLIGSVGTHAKNSMGAKDLLKFLKAPEALSVYKKKGMEPL